MLIQRGCIIIAEDIAVHKSPQEWRVGIATNSPIFQEDASQITVTEVENIEPTSRPREVDVNLTIALIGRLSSLESSEGLSIDLRLLPSRTRLTTNFGSEQAPCGCERKGLISRGVIEEEK